MKIVQIFFLLFLISISFGEVARFDFGNGVAFTLADISLFFLLLSWIVIRNKKILQAAGNCFFIKPLLIFAIVCFISLAVNYKSLNPTAFIVSFLYLIRFLFYAGIFFVVKSFSSEMKKISVFALIILAAVLDFWGYIQYFFYPSLRNLYYLGWDEHLYRLFSVFLDPNFAAVIFAGNFFFLLSIIFTLKKNQPRFNRSQKIKKIFISALCLLTFIAAIMTYSRSGIVMLVVSSFCFLFLIGKKKWPVTLALILLIFTIFLSKTHQSEGTNFLRTASVNARIKSMQRGLQIFKDHPVLGVGFNSYRYAQQRYGYKQSAVLSNHAGAGVENSYIFILATTGAVGFAAFLFFWEKILQFIYRKISEIKTVNKYYYQAFFSVIIGLLVNAFFINSLFYPFVLIYVWMFLGFIY